MRRHRLYVKVGQSGFMVQNVKTQTTKERNHLLGSIIYKAALTLYRIPKHSGTTASPPRTRPQRVALPFRCGVRLRRASRRVTDQQLNCAWLCAQRQDSIDTEDDKIESRGFSVVAVDCFDSGAAVQYEISNTFESVKFVWT